MEGKSLTIAKAVWKSFLVMIVAVLAVLHVKEEYVPQTLSMNQFRVLALPLLVVWFISARKFSRGVIAASKAFDETQGKG